MTRQDSGRNLLFGVIALQIDLIDPDRFAEACSAWAARRDVSLADLLQGRGWITPDDRADVERILRRKLERHGGDACRSLDDTVECSVRGLTSATAVLGDADGSTADFSIGPPAGGDPAGRDPGAPTRDASVGVRDRFRLVRMFAKGGLGQVWLARDPVLGRDVALKELRPERAGDPVYRARFLREARITGRLEHPGIVTVHELAGAAEGGRSFYAMQLVRGRTLRDAVRAYHDRHDACSGGALELHDLLDDFVAVCNAVGYAHSRGVIHRDLKGQNIVLGDFGEVVVLDWGLAKIVGEDQAVAAGAKSMDPDEAGDRLTLPGQQMGTPGYMAPEQAEGRDELIGYASDVYGLGAILYEILAGVPPFANSGVTEILRRVRDEDPTPPRAACPGVPRPLEAICMKALARRPGDRYPSATELAKDVKRWLADEPVLADREPASERLARWGRRHRPAMTAAAALLVAIAVGSTLAVLAVEREQSRTRMALASEARERRQAEINLALARDAVDNLYSRVAENPLLSEPRMEPLRAILIRTTQEYYARLVALNSEDPDLRSQLGWSYITLARVTLRAGEVDRAKDQLDRALNNLQGVCAARPGQADPRDGLAHCYLERGDALRETSRPEEAEAAYRQAIDLWARLASETGRPIYSQFLATAANCLGALDRSLGRWDRAAEDHTAAMLLLRGIEQSAPEGVDPDRVRDRLASCLVGLAGVELARGNPAGAEERYSEAHGIWTTLHEAHPRESYRSELATLLAGWSKARAASGRRSEAREMRERALGIWEGLAREYPGVVTYRDNIANEHLRIGEFFESEGNSPDAEAHYRTAAGRWAELAPRYPGRPDLKFNRARALFRLGHLHLHAGNGHRVEAADELRAARGLWEGFKGKLREDYARDFRADLEKDLRAVAAGPPE